MNSRIFDQSNKKLKLLSTTWIRFYSDVRVRFAPSPTGEIHLGGLRTALYNYIFARQNNGSFIIRIEDTDQKRLVPGSADKIEHILNWANLTPDESPLKGGKLGPYVQSKRLNLYKDKAEQLVEAGKAYRCFCSGERLDLLRKNQSRNREKPHYDGRCRNLSPSEIKEKLASQNSRHVIRFALKPGVTSFDDSIFGTISNNLVEIKESDTVLLKSDQYPTYHLANVVDDHEMRISHVLRGSEWLTSTAKHIEIYRAFGWQEPRFMHFPLISMTDGSKMSKRNNHSHVQSYIDAGYSPRALINFLTNMGGGVPKAKQDAHEVWDLDEIVSKFNFAHMSSHPGSVDIGRLRIYSSNDLSKKWQENPDEVLSSFKSALERQSIVTDLSDDNLKSILDKHICGRIITLNDLFTNDNEYIWAKPRLTWPRETFSGDLESIALGVINIVEDTPIDDKDEIIRRLTELGREHQMNKAITFKFIRMMITNNKNGLPIHEIFQCLGRERLLGYLENGLSHIRQQFHS